MTQTILREYPKTKNQAQPFIKWVGGKRQLLNKLIEFKPNNFKRYFEPFIGGGAFFFSLTVNNAYISDINPELINLYKTIQTEVQELINDLQKHKNSAEYFQEIRKADREENYINWSNVQKASRFIYLNRTCFNGLYRVNSKGYFNVPFGKYLNPTICNEENLLACHKALKTTQIELADFSKILDFTEKGDFVYFDPPYVPLNETSDFTSYTKQGFNKHNQEELRNLCNELNKRGVFFMLSNSDTPFIHELYRDYKINLVFASRAINSAATKRGKITEVIIKNY